MTMGRNWALETVTSRLELAMEIICQFRAGY
jgi:hypothetical protein